MSNIIQFPRNDLKHLSKERLLHVLDAAITATDSYEYLIGRIASVFEACEHASVGELLDELAVFEAVNEVELCITASAGDPRVIGLCRRALTQAGIGDEEIRILPEGEVERRMVYFARSTSLCGKGLSIHKSVRRVNIKAIKRLYSDAQFILRFE